MKSFCEQLELHVCKSANLQCFVVMLAVVFLKAQLVQVFPLPAPFVPPHCLLYCCQLIGHDVQGLGLRLVSLGIA